MKTIRMTIKEIQRGGFFKDGYVVLNIISNENGQDRDLGDYFISLSTKYQQLKKINEVKEKYKAMGYEVVGDWEIE